MFEKVRSSLNETCPLAVIHDILLLEICLQTLCNRGVKNELDPQKDHNYGNNRKDGEIPESSFK